jgi:hypothetical protein
MPRPVKKRRVALPEKIRQHLTDNYSIFPDDLNDLKNGHMLDLQVLALDPDENDQVQVAPNYLNVLAGVPQDLAVGLLG